MSANRLRSSTILAVGLALMAAGCEAFSPGFAEFAGERVRALRDRAAQHDTTLALRLDTLLPTLMSAENVDCWLSVADGPAGDPLVPLLTAATTRLEGKGALLLCGGDPRPSRIAIGRGLSANTTLYEIVEAADDGELARALNERLSTLAPQRIAINDSHRFAPADGLTAANGRWLRDALAAPFGDRLGSSRLLAERYLATLMPSEAPLVAESTRLAVAIAEDVLSDDVVVAAGTSLLDLDWAVRDRASQLDLEIAYPPRTVVYRASSDLEAERRMGLDVKLQHGDLVFLSFGTRYLGYANRVGRWAYLLPYGDSDPPPWVAGALGALADAGERLAASITVGQGADQLVSAGVAATADLTDPALSIGRLGRLADGAADLDAAPQVGPWDAGYALAADTALGVVLSTTWQPPDGARPFTLLLVDSMLVTAGGASFVVPPQREPLLIR